MTEKKQANQPDGNFLVAGLGASAGGLDALKRFFSSLPDNTGMAFIVIVHLSPEHESNMAELLQMETSLEVQQIKKNETIKADHVYVIPPKKLLEIKDNTLVLTEPDNGHGLATVDLFFRSLAGAKGKQAACVILSGSGNDGTVGIKSVKEHGGLTIAQDPDEAQYPGMPQSAIDSGLVDKVLPVEEIAEELQNYKKGISEISVSENGDGNKEALQKIFTRVQSKTGHDFSNYKRSSVLRRIERRMQVNRKDNLLEYHLFLQNHPEEAGELFKDLLISVTNFFRDREAFDALEEKVIPKLFENRDPDDQIRVWVPGCATGEEAYSIAMLLHEHAGQLASPPDIKVFASDIDEGALNVGRKGRYPRSISADVSQERLDRHFTKDGPEYKIKQVLREMILFAPHDLLRDPPFSKQDLIACRNLLIYLNRELQTEVFNLFHYTLRSEGYLFLGLSDSNVEASELFTALDKTLRIYRGRPTAESNLRLPKYPLRLTRKSTAQKYDRQAASSRKKSNFEALHQRLLTRFYAPESAIINENFEVLHTTDGIRKFLEYAGGEPSHDILEMILPELRQSLRGLLFKFEKKETPRLRKKVQLVGEESEGMVEINVHAINDGEFSDGLIQIVFKEIEESSFAKTTTKEDREEAGEQDEIIRALEEEIEYTKEQLQVTVEEYETSNEELRASNEELQSMNEELQSTTEELETSQEELQSVNEELKTVNRELENKVDELDGANDDLQNLMEATEVGIVFVDTSYRVQLFTTTSTQIFNLIDSDKGRPLKDVTHQLEYENLQKDIRLVHERLENIKKVVKSVDDRWYIMRLRPYRSSKDIIEGVVLTFVEFTKLRVAEDALDKQEYQESLATLGVYALEQDDADKTVKRAIDIGCLSLKLDCAVMYSFEKDENTYNLSVQTGCAKDGEPLAVDDQWDAGFALNHFEEPTVVTEYGNESRFGLSPFLDDENITSSVHVAVRGSDEMYGLLGFYSEDQREFTDQELHFLQVLANITGMAMQEKYSKEQLKKVLKRSEQLQREIINNSVAERWEIGGYLHDELGQLLVSMKIQLGQIKSKVLKKDPGTADELQQVNALVDDSINGIRDLTHDIIPVDVEEEGVEHALRFLVHQTQKLYEVQCKLRIDDVLNEIKNREAATNLYFVVQEAIKNAAVHGKANLITISISGEDEQLLLVIEDDGVGLAQTKDPKNGKGLRIMRHRTELLDGGFTIEEITDSGKTGTRVRCMVPLQQLQRKKQ